MIFVTGPLFSGKKEYIKEFFGWDDETLEKNAVADAQDLVKELIQKTTAEGDITVLLQEELEVLADKLATSQVVIATEVGGGIVPMDPEERKFREAAGRLACLLSKRAEKVVRVCCGLPQILKEEKC